MIQPNVTLQKENKAERGQMTDPVSHSKMWCREHRDMDLGVSREEPLTYIRGSWETPWHKNKSSRFQVSSCKHCQTEHLWSTFRMNLTDSFTFTALGKTKCEQTKWWMVTSYLVTSTSTEYTEIWRGCKMKTGLRAIKSRSCRLAWCSAWSPHVGVHWAIIICF